MTDTSYADSLFGLAGKTALITGANRGIGRGIALEMARLGANVIVAGRNTAGCEAVVEEIRAMGGTAAHQFFTLDSAADITAMMQTAATRFGRLDILVNNAGSYPPTDLLETSGDQWDELYRHNLRGPFLCLREAAKQMKSDGKGGRIINISSMGSVLPTAPGRFVYNAMKAGVNRLTQDAASGLAAEGILVNAVLPGPIEVRPVDPENAAEVKLVEALIRRVPVKRRGTPEDIAHAVIFLAGPASTFITGQTLLVDGGFTLGR